MSASIVQWASTDSKLFEKEGFMIRSLSDSEFQTIQPFCNSFSTSFSFKSCKVARENLFLAS